MAEKKGGNKGFNPDVRIPARETESRPPRESRPALWKAASSRRAPMIGPAVLCLLVLACAGLTGAAEPQRVLLQTSTPYVPEYDIKPDGVLLAGINRTFPERARQWAAQGCPVRAFNALMRVSMSEFPGAGEIAQTRADGSKLDRGDGYEIVPTLDYLEFLKARVRLALDTPEVYGIEFEEPEWVGHRGQTGYGEAFKKEWVAFYGEPWQAPDASAEALYRSNKLKYALVHRAAATVLGYAKEYARQKGRTIQCSIAAHSLASWLHDGTVGPFASLSDDACMDAYRVQVWTLTGGVENVYQGLRKARPFETQYLEYAEAANLVRPARMRYEIDNEPLGDEKNLSYATWKAKWEPGTVASLMFPEAQGYRPIVWPQRLFSDEMRYLTPEAVRKMKQQPGEDDAAAGERAPIPASYRTEALVAVNAIREVMKQKDFTFDSGPAGVGVLVSDAMMFQRKFRDGDKADLSAYYGLALPLLKVGVRVEPVRLEHAARPGFLKPYRVLLAEYETQKPQQAKINQALAEWVKGGGALLLFGDGKDTFNTVREWWNQGARKYRSPRAHLLECLGLGTEGGDGPHRCGRGWVLVDSRAPDGFAKSVESAAALRLLVRQAFRQIGAEYWEQNYFRVRRGPYVMAKVFDETPDVMPLMLEGPAIDLFDPALTVAREKMLIPGESAFLLDLAKCDRSRPAVLAAAARISEAKVEGNRFSFVAASPTGTRGATRLCLPAPPKAITLKNPGGGGVVFEQNWDAGSGTLFLGYPNQAGGVRIEVTF